MDPRVGACRARNRWKSWPPKLSSDRSPLRLRMSPFLLNIGIRCLRIRARRLMVPNCGGDGLRKSSATCCGSPAVAVHESSRFRRPMRSASTGRRRSGRMSDNGCSITPASSAPDATKRTAAGPRSNSRRICRSALSESLDARMAPKYHPTPLHRRRLMKGCSRP
jgi:hypothetical protein